jgi:hypothetical protein
VGSAIAALFYLRVTSLRNAVISRVTRLKRPKYLVGAVVGVAYVGWVVLGRGAFNRAGRTGPLAQSFPLERLPAVAAIGALVVTVLVGLYWVWPRSRAALTFSEAEIAFLFPAPIGRKTLLHFRWINAQLRILFTSLLLALFSARWGFVPGNGAVRIVGWWLILSTVDLHAVGSSFALTRLLDRGMTSWRRSLLTFALAAAAVAGALLGAWRGLRWPEPGALADPAAVADYFAALLATEPLAWLLTPARWVVQPLLAYDLRSFLAALAPALLVFAAHYWWVLRAEVSFEEASIAKAEKRAVRRATALRGGEWRIGAAERKAQRAPFALAAAGRPEIAFLWKNLLASASYLRPRVAVIAAVVIVASSLWLRGGEATRILATVIAIMAAVCAGYLLVFGPLVARQDLRLDLHHTDVLKTYPLRGWQIVLGEMLAPIAVITVLLWLMLLTAALNFTPPPRAAALTAGARTAAALVAGLLLPFLCAILVLVMNAAVVIFPAWIPQGGRARGIDVLGQRIFFVAALLLAMATALLPAALGAAAVFVTTFWTFGTVVAATLAVVVVAAILGAELALGIAWLGKRFESFDLSIELKA